MVKALVETVGPKMDKVLEHLDGELASLRTGRASTSLVEAVEVEVYGQKMPLKSLASLAAPDAHTVAITAWDKATVAAIEKAIREATWLGLNPSNDGNIIRLNIPPMTEDRRKEVVKRLGELAEAGRVSLRSARHEILNEVKRMVRAKQATPDDVKWAEEELNKRIDQYQAKIEELTRAKEREIMAV